MLVRLSEKEKKVKPSDRLHDVDVLWIEDFTYPGCTIHRNVDMKLAVLVWSREKQGRDLSCVEDVASNWKGGLR